MRKITGSERKFVSFLIEQAGYEVEIPEFVKPMKDGGMGSISFDLEGNQRRARQITAGTFKDRDGVLVDFELTVNDEGDLFELDLWKVDFSMLKSMPQPNEIKITRVKKGGKNAS